MGNLIETAWEAIPSPQKELPRKVNPYYDPPKEHTCKTKESDDLLSRLVATWLRQSKLHNIAPMDIIELIVKYARKPSLWLFPPPNYSVRCALMMYGPQYSRLAVVVDRNCTLNVTSKWTVHCTLNMHHN